MKINTPFKNIAVIGAGTMGSGIAGQIANSDQEVLLLDIQGETPNSITENAVKKLIKSDPPALMHKTKTKLIKIGNIEEGINDFELAYNLDNFCMKKYKEITKKIPKGVKTIMRINTQIKI